MVPTYKRQDTDRLLKSIERGETAPVYFLLGDRYLCREFADELIRHLLPDEGLRASALRNIDGDQEDVGRTIGLLKSHNLFSPKQVLRVTDSRILEAKGAADQIWKKALKARDGGDLPRAGRTLARMLTLAGIAPDDWQRERLAELKPERWQELFAFAKPDDLAWVGEALTAAGGSQVAGQGEESDLLLAALEAGLPAGNTLLLVAETADRRKKLFKYLEKHCVVVDLSVESGGGSAGRKERDALIQELVRSTLARLGKRLEPGLLPIFLERVGFQPLAVVAELEKLALSVGDAPLIGRVDLDAMVGRSREEAVYELTEALAGRNPEAFAILRRLLENGAHPLALLAGLRNFFRKLLLLRSIEDWPDAAYVQGLSFAAFQKGFLPRLKEEFASPLPQALNGHPYAVYNAFRQAEAFSMAELKRGLTELLRAEYWLKGSGLAEGLVLETFLFSFFRDYSAACRQNMKIAQRRGGAEKGRQ